MRLDTLPLFATAGATVSLSGAISHDEVVTWAGVGVAVGSAVVSFGLGAYHKYRAAVRDEMAADAVAVLARASKLAEAQAAFEARVAESQAAFEARVVAIAGRLAEVEAHAERVRCRFPNSDGSAKCTGREAPP